MLCLRNCDHHLRSREFTSSVDSMSKGEGDHSKVDSVEVKRKRKSCTNEDLSENEEEVQEVENILQKKRKIETIPVTVLDGGMGRELDEKFPDPDFKYIWSAASLLNQPDSVSKCHLSFIEAGAEVITTSNYSCVPSYLAKMDIVSKMYDLIKIAGEQAKKARESSKDPSSIRIAGSLPPYGFSYMGMKIPDNSDIVSSYVKMTQILYPYVDILLCETMSSIDEAVTALSGVQSAKKEGELGERDLPVWLSFSLLENDVVELHSGEKLEEALEEIMGRFPGLVEGLFLNCCSPKSITAGLPVLIEIGKKHGVSVFGAYANRFAPLLKSADEIEKSFKADAHVRVIIDIPEEEYLEHIKTWVGMGCSIVGGCCGMGPSYIEKISQFVESSGVGNTPLLH